MIDYDKLKEAHDLANETECEICYGLRMASGNILHLYGIDHLIEKLNDIKDLIVKPNKPKYEIGQEVWLLDCDMICTATINGWVDDEYRLKGCKSFDDKWSTGKDYALEEQLHSSREDLIDAQLEYWSKLKNESMQPNNGGSGEFRSTREICDHLIKVNAKGEALICEKCGIDMGRIKLDWRNQ